MRKILLGAAIIVACSHLAIAQGLEPAGYNPVEYHRIQLNDAKSFTAQFQATSAAPAISMIAGTLSARAVRAILAAPKAVYLREYFALDDAGHLHLLLVAKTADNHDIITSRITEADGSTISEATARKWIKNYAASTMFAKYGSVYASSIHRDAIQAVITRNNATSLRFYFASESGRIAAVVSGITAQNIESSEYIVDRTCCPPLDINKGELAQ
jgi:hypothetical protein